MKLINLKAENYSNLEEVDIDVEDMGLVLIQGANETDSSANSNGSGKSSFASIVSYALYGETTNGVSGDDVIHNQVGKDCFAGVTFKIDDEVYRVERYRKHHEYKNLIKFYKGDDDLTQGTNALTQELIDQTVGCSYNVFKAAIYIGQEAMPDLPAMTDKQLKEIIEEGAGIDVLQKASDIANDHKKTAENALKSHLSMVSQAQAQLQGIVDDIARIKDSYVEYIVQVDNRVESKKSQIHNANLSLQTEQEKLTKESAKVDKLKQEKADIESKAFAGESEQLTHLKAQVKQAELSKALLDNSLFTHANALKKQKLEYDSIALKVGTECGECGKPYQESDLEQVKALSYTRLKQMADETRVVKAKAEEANLTLTALQNELKTLEENTPDSNQLLIRFNEINDEIQQFNNQQKTIAQIIYNIKTMEEELKSLEKDQLNNPFTKLLDDKKRDKKALALNVSELIGKTEQLEKELEVTNQVVDVFSRNGVRAHILDTVTPMLNEKTAEYLTLLTDGNIQAEWTTLSRTKKDELKEKFSINVKKLNGADNFKALSGGEKKKVRLSCLLALQDLIASRADKPINFIILDEIETAMDGAGLERLFALLELKGKGKDNIFVISHNDLNSYFDRSITIKNENGFASIV